MESLITAFFEHPLYYVSALMAAAGGFGALLFFAGFFGGLPNVFHMRGHDGHLHHSYLRMVWGFYIMITVYSFWEILRVFVGMAPGTNLVLPMILLIPVWISLLRFLLFH